MSNSILEWKRGDTILPANTIVRSLAMSGATSVRIRSVYVVEWEAPVEKMTDVYDTEAGLTEELAEYTIDWHGRLT